MATMARLARKSRSELTSLPVQGSVQGSCWASLCSLNTSTLFSHRASAEWKRCDFVEYDVEADPAARHRMQALAAGHHNVPLLVEDGKVVQIGWQGRSCMVDVE
jgi:hypothetical protein